MDNNNNSSDFNNDTEIVNVENSVSAELTVDNALNVGDFVYMLTYDRGKNYFVVGKV